MNANAISVPPLTLPPGALAMAQQWESVSQLTTEALRVELKQGLQVTAACLLRLALVIRALEERGEDVSDLARLNGLLNYLRLIAHGQVLPELVVRLTERPDLLRRARMLPLPEQERLAQGEPVKVVVRSGEVLTHRMADPVSLTSAQVKQVFARDHLRSEAEQRSFLETAEQKGRTARPNNAGVLKIDRERGGVLLGKKFVPLVDLLAAVKALRN